MFRTFGAAAVAASLLVVSATVTIAGEGALAPGNQAGVKQALSLGDNGTTIVVAGAIVAGGLALALSGNDNGSATLTSAATTLP